MYYSLTGTLIHREPAVAVIECGGVGYKCFVSMTTAKALPALGATATLYTHLSVREDAMDLYGFSDLKEQTCFRLLTGVSGVGPKMAMAILSEFDPQQIALCVAAGDSKTLTRASGVGPKLAGRLVLELRDKFTGDGAADTSVGGVEIAAVEGSNANEAISALAVLGYSRAEAAQAVARLDQALSVEELIRQALRAMAERI